MGLGEVMASPKIGRKSWEEHRERVDTGQIIPPGTLVEEIIPDVVDSHAVAVAYLEDPDAAADELLKYLPEDVQSLIREASKHMALPVWQMLLGYAMRMHEMGELFVPYVLASSWEAGRKANLPRHCRGCGLLFKSRFATAEYCCNPCHFKKLEKMGGHTQECPTHICEQTETV